MTELRTIACAVCLLGCVHDVDKLETAPGSWLPEAAGADCIDCAVALCGDEERACAAEETCVSRYRSCSAPSPVCGVGSLESRSFAACVVGACRDRCGFAARELDCLGQYSWPKPEFRGPTRVYVDLRPFAGDLLPSTQAELCSELDVCQPLTPWAGARFQASYEWSAASPFRPLVRVHGDGVKTALYFEGADLSHDYVLTVSVLSKLTYDGLLTLAEATPDERLGTIAAVMYGCTTSRLKGVSFRLERNRAPLPEAESGIPFYFTGDSRPQPSRTASETRGTNVGGFANLKPATYDVSAMLGDRVIGRMDNVVVEAGALTQVNIFPLSEEQ